MIYGPNKEIPVLPATSLCVVATQDNTTITASIDGETVPLATFQKKGSYVIPIPAVNKIKADKPVSVTQGTFSLGSFMVGSGDGGAKVDALRYKGSVSEVDRLPTSAEVGDMYNVEKDGNNYAWTGSSWDSLGPVLVVQDAAAYGGKDPISTGWAFRMTSAVDWLYASPLLTVDTMVYTCVDYANNRDGIIRAISFVDERGESLSSVPERLTAHTNNATIHITADERERLDDAVRLEMIYDEVPAELATPAGTIGNATGEYIELDAQHVPTGKLVSISLRSRTASNPSTFSYLGLWELGEDGETWTYLGSSTNNPGQAMNTTKTWDFAPGEVTLSGRKLRILPQAERSNVWETGRLLGTYCSRTAEGDTTQFYRDGTGYDFLPEMSIAVLQQVPKFVAKGDFESHAADATIHITADERTKWNNAATDATAANVFTDQQKSYLRVLADSTSLQGKTGYLLVEEDLTPMTTAIDDLTTTVEYLQGLHGIKNFGNLADLDVDEVANYVISFVDFCKKHPGLTHTREIWLETDNQVREVRWPSNAIWASEYYSSVDNSIAPGLAPHTAYRFIVRVESNEFFPEGDERNTSPIIRLAYSYNNNIAENN